MGNPTLTRPLKTGNVRTYVDEVNALAPNDAPIRATEVDADIDLLVNAWNDPASNFPPGGNVPAGGDLAGSYPAPVLKPGAVTDAKVSDVAYAKITGAPTSLPPSGAASGSLAGSFPAPTIAPSAVRGTPSSGGTAREIAKASIWGGDDLIDASVPTAKLAANAVTTAKLADAPNGVTTAKISDAAVTDVKIAGMAYSKLTGAPTSLPPSGAAGGDLAGSYPAPTLKAGLIPTTLPPSGSAGGSLAGSYPAPTIAASGVTSGTYGAADKVAKIVVNAEGRVTSVSEVAIAPTGGSPSGSAGGDLAGSSYPNPVIAANAVNTAKILDGAVTLAKLAAALQGPAQGSFTGTITAGAGVVQCTPRGSINAGANYFELHCNSPDTPSYVAGKPSWFIRGDYTSDAFQVWRAPAGTTNYVLMLQVDGAGNLTLGGRMDAAYLFDGTVSRVKTAVNALNGGASAVAAPANLVVNTVNVWTVYATLPAFTTRGGWVHLHANTSLSAVGPTGGGVCNQRWLRDGAHLTAWSFMLSCPQYVPVPGINFVDTSCPAGSHTYQYQVLAATGCAMVSTSFADAALQAVEIG